MSGHASKIGNDVSQVHYGPLFYVKFSEINCILMTMHGGLTLGKNYNDIFVLNQPLGDNNIDNIQKCPLGRPHWQVRGSKH